MPGLSTTYRNALLDAMFNQTNITAPVAIYLSLHTADPGTTGVSEVTGSAYARVNCTTSFPVASGGMCANNVAIAYPTVTSPAYTATNWGLWDAPTAGTFICGGDINPDKLCAVGDIPEFPIGSINLAAA